MVVYKAAITGKRIVCPSSTFPALPPLRSLFVHVRHLRQELRLIKQLIYSPPPLFPLSAFGWCIAALSLPPAGVDRHMSDWLGQVGLMDITALHARKEGWVASTFTSTFPIPPHPAPRSFFLLYLPRGGMCALFQSLVLCIWRIRD